MKILNFGSLNLDYVYGVEHFVMAGETISSSSRDTFCGGKGLNQSVALAKAGGNVFHAGNIGAEGGMLRDMLESAGVDTHLTKEVGVPTGHAIIQVNEKGNNCIILFGGANQQINSAQIDATLAEFSAGDYLILQNEVNMLAEIIDKAYAKGMVIFLNPSPFDDKLKSIDYNKISYILLNEVEGAGLSGKTDYEEIAEVEGAAISGKTEADEILDAIRAKYPKMKVVLTLGENGSVYDDGKERTAQSIFKVKAVDTTAAGDTFTGYFVTALAEGRTPAEALKRAAAASRKGAAPSVPAVREVEDFLAER